MRHLRTAILSFLAMAAITAAGQSKSPMVVAPTSATASSDATPMLQRRDARYQLRKGDTFDLVFAYSPEFNQTIAVQPDGYVSLKEIGSILVEGKTIPELTDVLTAAYGKILHNPSIEISPREFEKPYFIAGGQVSKPGKYDLRTDLTVTEAIAIAGGFNSQAKHSQVVLFRPLTSGGYEAKLLDVKQMLASRNLAEDPQLRPGDMLYVPQNTISKIKPFLPVPSFGAAALF
jgi:polysaccharide biosynthesis/export protein